jgi:galactokinase
MPFEPQELVDEVVRRFPEAAGERSAIRVARAPGRVNLIGEHTDYNLGFVLPAAIDREIRIAALPAADRRVELVRLDTGDSRAFDLAARREREGSWIEYVAGVAWALEDAGFHPAGIRGVIATTLPPDAGLSSSAALELAAAWALLGDAAATIEPLELARICQRAENEHVGVRTGLMDQFAAANGRAGSALLLDCRSLDWQPVRLPNDVALVVIDSGVPRSLHGSAYNERRAQCEAAAAGLRDLEPGIESLREVSMDLLDRAAGKLDPAVARRARHVIAENRRVLDTVDALEANDLPAVGRLFAESHQSLRDLYEVSSPELDALVDIAMLVPGVIAARLTGAGFGGCTINLVRPDAVDALCAAVDREYTSRAGRTASVMPVRAAAGAGFVAPRA